MLPAGRRLFRRRRCKTVQEQVHHHNRVTIKNLPYDPDKDFTLISAILNEGAPFVASAKCGAENLKQFVLSGSIDGAIGSYTASFPVVQVGGGKMISVVSGPIKSLPNVQTLRQHGATSKLFDLAIFAALSWRRQVRRSRSSADCPG